ncbi:histidine ABC transporter substrate-binding protein [Leisingera sp. JC1]|nr:histidine ABC transporter substrate-binding protein [Leisingera sp. JC1]
MGVDALLQGKTVKKTLITLLISGAAYAAAASASQASYCSNGNKVTFAGIDWESGAFVTEVMQRLLAKGYDCQVDAIPGNSVTLEQAVAMNDVQIIAEEWIGRSDVWNKAAKEGKVTHVGQTFLGASEGWFVPAYVVKGDPARGIEPLLPDLKSVSQLQDPEVAAVFRDPEEPAKGRFLNCPSGWTCEGVSTAKLEGYGLEKLFVNFRPGTGTALDSAIASAYLQRQPLLFYYWSPTAIMGKYDLIQLEEPAYSDACWAELTSADGKRDGACGFPPVDVAYGVNTTFAEAAPDIIAILEKAVFPLQDINESLAFMKDSDATAAEAADRFLKDKAEVWETWVSGDAKAKILASFE